MITIKEIAERAGVSAGTVDRVLHNRGRVSKENEAIIKKIAEENGYVPNLLARRLQQGRRLLLGVLIPDPETEYGYWKQIADGVEEARREIEALDAFIVFSFFDRHDKKSFIKAGEVLMEQGISAYIAAPIVADGMRELSMRYPDIPYVFIDSSLPDLNPLWDFAQNPIIAGHTGARLMCMSPFKLDLVITLQMHKGAFNGEMRAAAFNEAFTRLSPGSRVINIYADSQEEIYSALAGNLPEDGSPFGVFIVSDQAAIVCSSLERLDCLNRSAVVGFDLSAVNREGLLSGKIFAIIGQRPRAQGHDAVMAIYNHFMLSSEQKGNFSAPVDIYIKENIPESEHWL